MARVNGVIGGDGQKFFYQNDTQGTALAITDENGNQVVERDYSPFGERLQQKENDTTSPDEDDSAFTGKDWDGDIGLYYYNARWYDPEIGRFTSEDSVADDPNLYGYCFNNPMNMTDPTGHDATGIFKQGLGLFMAAVNAMALLTNNSDLSNAMSVFSLFIAVDNKIHEPIASGSIQDSNDSDHPTGKDTGSGGTTTSPPTAGPAAEPSSTETTTEDTTTTDTTITNAVDTTNTATVTKISTKNDSSVVSEDSKEKIKELAKDDPTAKQILDKINGPVGVKFTLVDGIFTISLGNGFYLTIEELEDVTITKGTITIKFGPDGRISSITGVNGNKIRSLDKQIVKLTVALAQPTEISFGKNSAFTVKNELFGEMNSYGRPTIFSTTFICNATGQAIKVSIGLDYDMRGPAPQRVPMGIPAILPILMRSLSAVGI